MEAALHAGSFLAADLVQPLSENSRRGHRLSTAILYPGVGFVNSNTATGLRVCLYDEGRGSRCTSKERDSESGLDYFGARYYGSALGRWTSPDWSSNPVPIPFSRLENPQTFNLYSYVENDPLSLIDKDGHDDYAYDQSGNQTNVKKRGFWHNFFIGNTYTMNLTAGGSISLYGPIDHPLENVKQFTIVSTSETTEKASAFVVGKIGDVKDMGWLGFADNSKNGHPLDFKQQLDTNSLYLWSDGKAYDRDGIGNITWGYLSYFAINGQVDNATAHVGAAAAQVMIDRTSRPEWIFSHTLGDRPKDFDAINAGRTWAGERPGVDLSKGWAH